MVFGENREIYPQIIFSAKKITRKHHKNTLFGHQSCSIFGTNFSYIWHEISLCRCMKGWTAWQAWHECWHELWHECWHETPVETKRLLNRFLKQHIKGFLCVFNKRIDQKWTLSQLYLWHEMWHELWHELWQELNKSLNISKGFSVCSTNALTKSSNLDSISAVSLARNVAGMMARIE